jgi:hypothetical protein
MVGRSVGVCVFVCGLLATFDVQQQQTPPPTVLKPCRRYGCPGRGLESCNQHEEKRDNSQIQFKASVSSLSTMAYILANIAGMPVASDHQHHELWY